jgi:hypothetical protein
MMPVQFWQFVRWLSTRDSTEALLNLFACWFATLYTGFLRHSTLLDDTP